MNGWDSDLIVSLAVAILFLVFIAYEIAGSAPFFPDLHTVSYYAFRHLWLRVLLLLLPPTIYMGWWLWHMSHYVAK